VSAHAQELTGTPGDDTATTPYTSGDHLVDRLVELGIDRLPGVLGSLGSVVPVVSATPGSPPDALVGPTGAAARRYGIGDQGMAWSRPNGETLAAHLTVLVPGAVLDARVATA
jgi:hypothetical protein